MRRPTPRSRRGDLCETCSTRLNAQGVILLDGHRRLYLCRDCCLDAWARRDAADEHQRAILEQVWALAPWQAHAGVDDLGAT